jgi:predicted Mrr-cat superfamily restriction endonuclease
MSEKVSRSIEQGFAIMNRKGIKIESYVTTIVFATVVIGITAGLQKVSDDRTTTIKGEHKHLTSSTSIIFATAVSGVMAFASFAWHIISQIWVGDRVVRPWSSTRVVVIAATRFQIRFLSELYPHFAMWGILIIRGLFRSS